MSDSELKTPEELADWILDSAAFDGRDKFDEDILLDSITAAISAERQRAEKLLERMRFIATCGNGSAPMIAAEARAAIDEFEKERG